MRKQDGHRNDRPVPPLPSHLALQTRCYRFGAGLLNEDFNKGWLGELESIERLERSGETPDPASRFVGFLN